MEQYGFLIKNYLYSAESQFECLKQIKTPRVAL